MSILVSEQVHETLQSGAPIVALETAVLTSGLPRCIWNDSFGACPSQIESTQPINWALAKAMTAAVEQNGATPVWIGMLNGIFIIGMNQEELLELSTDETATKVSLATFAKAMHEEKTAGTTVAATLLGCKLANPERPIRVFATGGIGGVHKNWSTQLDVSADLTALATTPTCVVASGAKSILDVHATVEALETIGVPVLGMGCDRFPPFIERFNSADPIISNVSSIHELAEICKIHWNLLKLPSAILAGIPVPDNAALERGSLAEALQKAEQSWFEKNMPSTTRTPYLLGALAEITQGASLIANLELLCNNAKIAGKLAVSLSD
jgi:pseudouridine-5'-phosphate glycosidase